MDWQVFDELGNEYWYINESSRGIKSSECHRTMPSAD